MDVTCALRGKKTVCHVEFQSIHSDLLSEFNFFFFSAEQKQNILINWIVRRRKKVLFVKFVRKIRQFVSSQIFPLSSKLEEPKICTNQPRFVSTWVFHTASRTAHTHRRNGNRRYGVATCLHTALAVKRYAWTCCMLMGACSKTEKLTCTTSQFSVPSPSVFDSLQTEMWSNRWSHSILKCSKNEDITKIHKQFANISPN